MRGGEGEGAMSRDVAIDDGVGAGSVDVTSTAAGTSGPGEEAGGSASGTEEQAAGGGGDSHENDLVMPGFRFHPTEEELIEFYLRRKVEGRRFNIELITFLDLYRYDPWMLPAMATIGEKEWFFYVPRDRKYRNGDRPNRVTASGYWKATGADRMIRAENNRPIGLKKTLVFYSGKAPKGVRSSWIMNEYRLPPPAADADLFYKSEISLCRVYKRSGIDDGHGHHQRPSGNTAGLPARRHRSSPSTSSTPLSPTQQLPSFHQLLQGESSSSSLPASATCNASQLMPPPPPRPCAYTPAMGSMTAVAPAPTESAAVLASTYSLLNMAPHAAVAGSSSTSIDELSTLVGHHSHAAYGNHPDAGSHHFLPLPAPTSQLMPQLGTTLPTSPLPAVSDKLWDWNSVPDHTTDREYKYSSGLSDPK
uniref:NAC domain-containing protein n=1 Tax=Oryza brachyantha TaxID=4533 RepID=J3M793_ORYBR